MVLGDYTEDEHFVLDTEMERGGTRTRVGLGERGREPDAEALTAVLAAEGAVRGAAAVRAALQQ